jgi:DNA invertase Pin-like site-specific DNA recombinase
LPENFADFKPKKLVIELIRVSTEAQAGEDRAGVQAQKAVNRRTAAQYGLEISRTILITDVSGAMVLQSPEMQDLLRSIRSKLIHGVVAKEFSRLMRPDNLDDFALLQVFANTSTILYLPDGPMDLASKYGRLFGVLRAAIAGVERTEILERIWFAKEEKRRAGEHAQSQIALPFAVDYERRTKCWSFNDDAEKVRQAFHLFLSGETSFVDVGRKVGINPITLRVVLRNPIYTGWRVYNKRRDPSPEASRPRPGGRQGDRPKIQRALEDVIRVKVLESLVSEADFHRVQQILNLKRQNHWRARPDHLRRFTYSGFLRCGECGSLMYSHANRKRDWYVCKNRTWPTRGTREKLGLAACKNPYMNRVRVESTLDALFERQLTDRVLLSEIAVQFAERSGLIPSSDEASRIQRLRAKLQAKERRILDAYLDNLIDRQEVDRRRNEIKLEQEANERRLADIEFASVAVSPEELAKSFEPLHEWPFLSRTDKRKLLQAVVPEIYLENYRVSKLAWLTPTSDRHELNHTDKDSSPPPT